MFHTTGCPQGMQANAHSFRDLLKTRGRSQRRLAPDGEPSSLWKPHASTNPRLEKAQREEKAADMGRQDS